MNVAIMIIIMSCCDDFKVHRFIKYFTQYVELGSLGRRPGTGECSVEVGMELHFDPESGFGLEFVKYYFRADSDLPIILFAMTDTFVGSYC